MIWEAELLQNLPNAQSPAETLISTLCDLRSVPN